MKSTDVSDSPVITLGGNTDSENSFPYFKSQGLNFQLWFVSSLILVHFFLFDSTQFIEKTLILLIQLRLIAVNCCKNSSRTMNRSLIAEIVWLPAFLCWWNETQQITATKRRHSVSLGFTSQPPMGPGKSQSKPSSFVLMTWLKDR